MAVATITTHTHRHTHVQRVRLRQPLSGATQSGHQLNVTAIHGWAADTLTMGEAHVALTTTEERGALILTAADLKTQTIQTVATTKTTIKFERQNARTGMRVCRTFTTHNMNPIT